MNRYETLRKKLNCALRPIEAWPGKYASRRSSQFRAQWRDTCELLARELDYLKARNRVVQIALRRQEFRMDGLPRADARYHAHPGVILTFEMPEDLKEWKPTTWVVLSYPCDTYTDWQDNVRAIALALEALRAVDRYGVTRRGEQYAGWIAIEPPKPFGVPVFEGATDAAMWMQDETDLSATTILANRDVYRSAYLRAAAKLHPDSPGGNTPAFQRLQEARRLLDAHHGGAK